MKTTTRFIVLFLVFLSAVSYYLIEQLVTTIGPGYARALEETVNDTAQILAAELQEFSRLRNSRHGQKQKNYDIDVSLLRNTMQEVYKRVLNARIYELVKENVNTRVYVTDKHGMVLYDSRGKDEGKDFSLWNDVYLTLRGNYGARATRLRKDDPNSSSIYIGAPVYNNNKIVGVLTVVKEKSSVNLFIEKAAQRMVKSGILAALFLGTFTILIFLYISAPLQRLTQWVKKIPSQRAVSLPKLGSSEIYQLGKTIDNMRKELDGRKHVERTIRTLAHELKSPLTSMLAAAEIVQQPSFADLPKDEKEKFQSRLLRESGRMERIIEEISTLSRLEAMAGLEKKEKVDMLFLARQVCEDLQIKAEEKQIVFVWQTRSAPDKSEKNAKPRIKNHNKKQQAKQEQERCTNNKYNAYTVEGNTWLLRQVFVHLLSNALDFADKGSPIVLAFFELNGRIKVEISNTCDPIPDYALNKIFEQFYSLPRPDSQEKSSGLGLNICQEILALHNGNIYIENIEPRMVRVSFIIPAVVLLLKP